MMHHQKNLTQGNEQPFDIMEIISALDLNDYEGTLQQLEHLLENKIPDSDETILLMMWSEFATLYPTASDHLAKKAQDLRTTFEYTSSPDTFSRYANICLLFNWHDQLLDTFLKVHQENKFLARKLYPDVQLPLMVKGMWDICTIYHTSPIQEYEARFQIFDTCTNQGKNINGTFEEGETQRFITDTSDLLIILKNTMQINRMDEIVKKITADMSSKPYAKIAKQILENANIQPPPSTNNKPFWKFW